MQSRKKNTRSRTLSCEDNDQRWVIIFGTCLMFHNTLMRAKRVHTHRMQKKKKFQTLPSYLLLFWIRVLSFLPSTLCLLFVILFFLQLTKCSLGRVWEEITGSTPLRRSANQTNQSCRLFHKLFSTSENVFSC